MTDDIPEPDRTLGAPHPRATARLIGQDAAETTFLTAFNTGRLHHAWLITGPRGVGKATLAWRIAKFLLATPDDDGGMFAPPPPITLDLPDSPILHRINALSESRLFLLRRPYDEKTARLRAEITVDEVRKMKSYFTLSAADGGRRVAIIDAVDDMNTAAANALLKLLEEPPAKVTLLLIAHQPARLLPTIRFALSRIAGDAVERRRPVRCPDPSGRRCRPRRPDRPCRTGRWFRGRGVRDDKS
jgi:DNA polymerase III subunit delta'